MDFNPIIGLILTMALEEVSFYNTKFQSHYRSDFNSSPVSKKIASITISIPL